LTAVILSLVFILWPLLTFAGGLAFPILSAVAALACLPVTARRLRPRWYMLPLAGFMIFTAVSALWSPRQFEWVDFDFAKGVVNVRSEMLRVGLLFAALGVLLAAARGWGLRTKRIVTGIALGALLLQVGIVLVLALYQEQALELFSDFMSNSGEGVQNISRNSIFMAVAAPVLIFGLTQGRPLAVVVLVALVILAAELTALIVLGTDSGLLALGASVGAMITVKLFPRHGFRVIACGIALIVMSAPILFGVLSPVTDPTLATTSLEWRMTIWNRVIEVIAGHPFIGAGVGVLRTILDTIPGGVFEGQMIVPNHAHNMTLQLWAETGAVGAGLLSLALLLAGWRLPKPESLGAGALPVAALAGGMTAIACVSFDLWNENWWAVCGYIAVVTVAVQRGSGWSRPAPAAVGITFGAPVGDPDQAGQGAA
jgi:O-antigen ligase